MDTKRPLPKWKSLLVILSLAGSLPAAAATTSGLIAGSETWEGEIFLRGDVIVGATGKLTIIPGTIVRCDARTDNQIGGNDHSHIELIVQDGGMLNAIGTEALPILFTSGPVPPQKAEVADWTGIRLSSDNVTLKYCTVEWAKNGVSIEGFHPVIQNCIFQDNQEGGAMVGGNAMLSNCTFRRNGVGVWDGTSTAPDSAPSIHLADCLVTENGNGVLSYFGSLECVNTEIKKNAGAGIANERGFAFQPQSFSIENCLIGENGNDGIRVSCFVLQVSHSFIGNNVGSGIIGETSHLNLSDLVVTNNAAGISMWSDVGVVTGSSIVNNKGGGLLLQGGSSDLVNTNVVSGNLTYGVYFSYMGATANVVITNSMVFANGTFEVMTGAPGQPGVSTTVPVIADGNYWGEPTTSELQNQVRDLSKIYDSRDDTTIGQVVIHSWLSSPAVTLAPTIVRGPASQTVYQGNNVALSVLVNGSDPLSYQWLKGGLPIAGATSSSLVLSSVRAEDAGSYSARITNSGGTATTAPAELRVTAVTDAPLLEVQTFAAVLIQGTVGKTYTVQYATNPDQAGDWRAWTTVTNIVLTSTPYVFVDAGSGAQNKRFYRAVLMP